LKDLQERYYFSGGSAREFCRDTLQEIKSNIDEAVAVAVAGTNIDWLFSRIPVKDGKQIDRIRRTFVMDVNNKDHYTDIACFDQVIDSEYAVRCLHHRISLGNLESIFEWAHRTKNKVLSGCLFEVLVHSYGAENHLGIRVKEYAIRKKWIFWKRSYSIRAGFTLLKIREGKALCSGNRWEYQDILKNFRNDDKFSYWFPDDYGFPNIDGIAKMKDEDGNCVIAYIQVTDAKKHAISLQHIIDMNNIFQSAASLPPIYIAVLPDPEALKTFHLEKNNVAFAIKDKCQVFVGYIENYKFGNKATGTITNPRLNEVKPYTHLYDLRKRTHEEMMSESQQ